MRPTVRDLYTLTKPGIIRGNALTAMGGFFLAAQGTFNGLLFAGMLVGLSLIVAAGCVLNNIIDRKIDARMSRTSKRAIPNGRVSLRTAYMYALILSLVGVATLALLTNALALTVSLFGLFMYVIIYGIAKRRSLYGTHIGSISGAVPPVVGYVSISGRLDVTALLLFLIVALWQMPHFFAIAIFRAKDYAAAAIPVLPLVKGVEAARRQILAYVLLFFLSVILLWAIGAVGITYLVIMSMTCVWWLWIGIKSYTRPDVIRWSKTMFGASLIVILIFSLMISIDSFLP